MAQHSSNFHLHLVSDSTGETLIAAARAVTSQYKENRANEHIHPMVRNKKQLQSVTDAITKDPGIVLYTIANYELADELELVCKQVGSPCVSLLEPIFQIFQSYLGKPTKRVVGAQHALDNEYFSRIDAFKRELTL